jgi:hypothetical protein
VSAVHGRGGGRGCGVGHASWVPLRSRVHRTAMAGASRYPKCTNVHVDAGSGRVCVRWCGRFPPPVVAAAFQCPRRREHSAFGYHQFTPSCGGHRACVVDGVSWVMVESHAGFFAGVWRLVVFFVGAMSIPGAFVAGGQRLRTAGRTRV